jgi:hypothetical protein
MFEQRIIKQTSWQHWFGTDTDKLGVIKSKLHYQQLIYFKFLHLTLDHTLNATVKQRIIKLTICTNIERGKIVFQHYDTSTSLSQKFPKL